MDNFLRQLNINEFTNKIQTIFLIFFFIEKNMAIFKTFSRIIRESIIFLLQKKRLLLYDFFV